MANVANARPITATPKLVNLDPAIVKRNPKQPRKASETNPVTLDKLVKSIAINGWDQSAPYPMAVMHGTTPVALKFHRRLAALAALLAADEKRYTEVVGKGIPTLVFADGSLSAEQEQCLLFDHDIDAPAQLDGYEWQQLLMDFITVDKLDSTDAGRAMDRIARTGRATNAKATVRQLFRLGMELGQPGARLWQKRIELHDAALEHRGEKGIDPGHIENPLTYNFVNDVCYQPILDLLSAITGKTWKPGVVPSDADWVRYDVTKPPKQTADAVTAYCAGTYVPSLTGPMSAKQIGTYTAAMTAALPGSGPLWTPILTSDEIEAGVQCARRLNTARLVFDWLTANEAPTLAKILAIVTPAPALALALAPANSKPNAKPNAKPNGK
jgi:hypothetical protein